MEYSENLTRREIEQSELDRKFGEVYESVGELRHGLMIVERDGKYGAIDKNGKIVIPVKYWYLNDFYKKVAVICVNETEEMADEMELEDLLAIEEDVIKQGLINNKGNLVTPLKYDDIAMEYCLPKFRSGLLKVKLDGLYGFINIDGEEVVPPIYEDAFDFTKQGFARVKKGEKWGIINTAGEEVIATIYTEVCDISEFGFAIVKKGEKWGVITAAGEVVIDIKHEQIWEGEGKICYFITMNNRKFEWYNHSGKLLSNDEVNKMLDKKRK